MMDDGKFVFVWNVFLRFIVMVYKFKFYGVDDKDDCVFVIVVYLIIFIFVEVILVSKVNSVCIVFFYYYVF